MNDKSIETVGPFGGDESLLWDDGVYSTVRQVVIYASSVIESIQIEYDDNQNSIWGEKHGDSEDGNKITVELDYPHEFLISISGHIGGSELPVHSLTFESNRRTYGPFGTEKGDYFKIQSTDGKKIIGFHGKSDYQLDGIGAYLEPKYDSNKWISGGPFGGEGGFLWNDGVHTTIRKMVIFYSEVIGSIEIEYDDNGQSKWSARHGKIQGKREAVELDYPSEFLISISGNIGEHQSNTVVCSLTFESNKKTYGPFGTENGTPFKFPSTNGGKIVGFHGRSGDYLDSIGAYSEPTSNSSQLTSVGPFGGQGGDRWDDGAHTTIRQVIIFSSVVIESIRTEYDKNGQSVWSGTHGRVLGNRNTVQLDYPYEFLISVSGHIGFHNSLYVIRSLTLKSNRRTYGPYGTQGGNYFEFPSSDGNKIIGFHGSSGYHLDSIGAYLEPISTSIQQLVSLGPFGGRGGIPWDDGAHTMIRQILVFSSEVIESILIEYDEKGQSKWSDTHGRQVGNRNIVQLDYPGEFLISIAGYHAIRGGPVVIHSLTLESNRKPYGPFGSIKGSYFKFPLGTGNKIIGFHGRSGLHLDSIGLHFESSSCSSIGIPDGPVGGDGGGSWDDGVHSGVRQLIIFSTDVIQSIQIEYDRNGNVVLSNTYGTAAGNKNIVKLDYPMEFLRSVSGYIRLEASRSKVIQSLSFESNIRTYGPFGTEGGGEYFELPGEDGKINGFHGRSGDLLDAIGVYYGP